VTVARDQAAIETDITSFVDAFNSVSSRVSKLTTTDPDGTNKGALVGDSTALSLRQELFSTMFSNAQGVSGQYRNLSQVGLTISKDGTLSLNTTKLQEALQNDSQAVADLFAARVQNVPPTTTQVLPGVPGVTTPTTTTDPTFSSLGVAERINRLASRYLDSTRGLLTGSSKSLTDQIDRQNQRIKDFDVKLASKRAQLTAQFSNLESSLAKLQQQQGALSRISGSQSTAR
jgi:flagellar capping protein FliD